MYKVPGEVQTFEILSEVSILKKYGQNSSDNSNALERICIYLQFQRVLP